MRLVNTFYNLELELKENQILILSVENPKIYREFLKDLWNNIKVIMEILYFLIIQRN